MDYAKQLKERLDELKGVVAVSRIKQGKPITAATLKTIETNIGAKVPATVAAFYRSMNGLELQWTHQQATLRGSISIMPLEQSLRGPRKKWNDDAWRETLWFDNFAELGEEVLATFKQLRPMQLRDSYGFALSRADLAGPVYYTHKDEAHALDLDAPRFFERLITTLGLEDWHEEFMPKRARSTEVLQRFQRAFAELKPLPVGQRSTQKKPSHEGGERVSVLVGRSEYRGTVITKLVPRKVVLVELDSGRRGWAKLTSARPILKQDQREELRAAPEKWKALAEDATAITALIKELFGPWCYVTTNVDVSDIKGMSPQIVVASTQEEKNKDAESLAGAAHTAEHYGGLVFLRMLEVISDELNALADPTSKRARELVFGLAMIMSALVYALLWQIHEKPFEKLDEIWEPGDVKRLRSVVLKIEGLAGEERDLFLRKHEELQPGEFSTAGFLIHLVDGPRRVDSKMFFDGKIFTKLKQYTPSYPAL